MATRLTLSLIAGPGNVQPQTRSVGGAEFTLGRSEDADWTLPDPDHVLSRRHCVFGQHAGDWCVTDLSGNGTFLNHEQACIGHDETRRLRDGDRLRIGAYEFQVQLIEAAPPPPAAPAWGADRFDNPFGPPPVQTPPPPVGPPGGNPFDEVADQPWAHPPVVLKPPAFDTGVWSAPAPVPPAPPSPAPLPAAARPPAFDTGVWSAPDPAFLPPIPPVPPPVPVAAPSAPVSSPPPATTAPSPEDSELLAAFLHGVGLPDAVPKNPVQAMQALGAAFRAMVIGLRDAQLARRTVRSGFRINQTISSRNPLKVAVSDEDALAALLGAGRPSPVPPACAVEEVLREIALHEVATVAAMQEAVRTLLASIDPARLREAAGQSLVPLQGKARAWDAYEARHASIVQALEDDFDSVFGRAFARAYERALAEAAERGTR